MNPKFITTKVILIVLSLNLTQLSFAQSNFQALFGAAREYQDVTVQKVLSTDTIIIENNTQRGKRIKLIGVKSPKNFFEKKKPERDEFGFAVKKEVSPETPIEQRALTYVKNLLEGKKIRLEFDVEKQNQRFETLAYIFLNDDDTFVNATILREGFASLRIRPPNVKYADKLRAAYKEARQEKRGLQGE